MTIQGRESCSLSKGYHLPTASTPSQLPQLAAFEPNLSAPRNLAVSARMLWCCNLCHGGRSDSSMMMLFYPGIPPRSALRALASDVGPGTRYTKAISAKPQQKRQRRRSFLRTFDRPTVVGNTRKGFVQPRYSGSFVP